MTNKQGKGRKGTLVAMVKGVESEKVIQILKKLPQSLRQKVKEITLDLAGSMERIARHCFPKARRVSDRFHVQQLAGEAVQELRIDYRWQAIEQENKEMELAKELGREHVPKVLANGDTLKQLLARSRYLLFKDQTQWTPSQHHRAEILFRHYPVLQKAYDLSRKLSHIFNTTRHKGVAFTRLAHWYNEVEASGLKSFNTLARTIQNHYATILNYFDNRATNASAEAFNAKIKALRSQFRGVRNIPFFMFRLAMIYA